MPTLTTKIIGNNNYFSLISLNINGLNSSIKRHGLIDWLHEQTQHSAAYRNPKQGKRETLPQNERMKNNFHSKWSEETSWSSHSNMNKIDFQLKVIKKKKKKKKK
jgi:exonuclease III